MEFDTSKVSVIVFKNCTNNGVKITAENAASLKTGGVTFFYNGVGSVSLKRNETGVVSLSKILLIFLLSGTKLIVF